MTLFRIITNRFAGGRMCALADDLARFGADICYLGPKLVGMARPKLREVEVVLHNGFDDYRKLVREMAKSKDAVILGAAVANLLPAKKIEGKFPSHNYRPGDIVPIEMKIAERVIDEVKKHAPASTHLFGFKLLSGASHEELIGAAYGIVLEARATAVIANDTENLDQKFAVTKERGVHPMLQKDVAGWIWEMLQDTYYSSVAVGGLEDPSKASMTMNSLRKMRSLIEKYSDKFTHMEQGIIFGTVAVRSGKGFVTTGRGKRELDSFAEVQSVDHDFGVVYVTGTKASLNAPLLAKIFENPEVDHIVHYHEQVSGLPAYPYAPPGTVRDSIRPNTTSFNIAEHGCMLLFDKNGRRL